MIKKCDAKCGADCDANLSHLWLRNNIFYYRVELPRKNNKRRYKRISLRTSNFYEAREILRQMTTDIKELFDRIRFLYNGLIFEIANSYPTGRGMGYGMMTIFQIQRRLSKHNKPKNIKELMDLSFRAEQINPIGLNQEDKDLLKEVVAMRPLLQKFIDTLDPISSLELSILSSSNSQPPSVSKRSIKEVLDAMLLKANNCKAEEIRKNNNITEILKTVGLSLEDDYSSFHNVETLDKITKYISSLSNVKGDTKRRYLRYIKELAICGSNIDPDNYKANVTANLPNLDKTKKSEKTQHKPYSKEQLLEIFDPKHNYFKENPDAFWACMIALFTGARANSAITLQYDDVFQQDGIDCIQFIENHNIKQLKNEASERIVPIHKQLLELGFVDYVRNRQKKLQAKGSEFIFPRCQTSSGKYNNKYTVRHIIGFFIKIGVKSKSKDGYNFHSFRKNISMAMQDAHIPASYINDTIGWEGKTTMEQSYSNHTLQQISEQLNKFSYDYLVPHFEKWRDILKKIKIS